MGYSGRVLAQSAEGPDFHTQYDTKTNKLKRQKTCG